MKAFVVWIDGTDIDDAYTVEAANLLDAAEICAEDCGLPIGETWVVHAREVGSDVVTMINVEACVVFRSEVS